MPRGGNEMPEGKKVYIEIDKNGIICYEGDHLCDHTKCDYWVSWLGSGNCSLRVKREHTLAEIGIALGFSKQRAEVVLNRALAIYRARMIKLAAEEGGVREMIEQCGIDYDQISVNPWD